MDDSIYLFLRAFIDFFFFPLYAMELSNYVYTVIYAVIITLAVWAFVRRILKCFGSM